MKDYKLKQRNLRASHTLEAFYFFLEKHVSRNYTNLCLGNFQLLCSNVLRYNEWNKDRTQWIRTCSKLPLCLPLLIQRDICRVTVFVAVPVCAIKAAGEANAEKADRGAAGCTQICAKTG